MNKVTKLSGLALASAAATLLLSGCGYNSTKADTDSDKSAAKVEAKSANSCSGKNSCKGKDSCKGKNSCSGK